MKIPIILHTFAVAAKGQIREAQSGLVNFTGLMTTQICSMEHESQGKTSKKIQGCSGFFPRFALF